MRAVASLLIVLLVSGCFGLGRDAPPAEPTPAAPTSAAPAGPAAPVFDPPRWRVGDRWDYLIRAPGVNDSRMYVQVVGDNESVGGKPVYSVYRSTDDRVVSFSKATLNQVFADGTEQPVYQWPLRDGASWTFTTGAWGPTTARAAYARDIVTPLGVLEGYRITEKADARFAVEVVHYAPAYKSYARIDNYEEGRPTLTLLLERYVPAE